MEELDTVVLSREAYTHMIEDIERTRADADAQHRLAQRYLDRANMLNDLVLNLAQEMQEYREFFNANSYEMGKFTEWKDKR